MTGRTHHDEGSTHIIRYALELGLLWIDGDGRDKVREALDALDTLEAQLEASHALDAHSIRVHRKRDGLLMVNARGKSRFMTLRERIAYWLLGNTTDIRP